MCDETNSIAEVERDIESYKELELSYKYKLVSEINKSCKAWVVEFKENIVASGVISIFSFYPTPNETTFMSAFVHSMYTEKMHRRNGLAIEILEKMKQYCKKEKIRRIFLRASDAGKPVYESIGFTYTEPFMAYHCK